MVSIYLQYYTNNCNNYKTDVTTNINNNSPNGQLPDDTGQSDDYKRCKLLDSILFWIQVGSLGMDLLASKMIRKQSKKLQDLGFPSDWNLPQFQVLKNSFEDLNNLDINNYFNFINQIPAAHRTVIGNKLSTFDIEKRVAFLEDFSSELSQPEKFWEQMAKNGGEAIDNWDELRVLETKDFKNINVIFDTPLSNRYIQYFSNLGLKNQLEKFDDASRLDFLKSPLAQVTPLPGPGYLNAWLKMQKNGTLSNFQTETILRKFDDFSDELVDKAMHEMTHAERGSGIRQLIIESPDDIKNVMKVVLENPHNAKTLLKETDNLRWKKWGDGQFFKYFTHIGKKFETSIVNKGLRKRTGGVYNLTKNKILSLTGKNIDEYQLFTGLQLNIKGTGNYFVADQVFVKFTKNSRNENIISDIIVMETKLTDATKLSARQGEAFINKTGGFSARTKNPQNIYDLNVKYKKQFENIINEPTFIKCFDKTDGSEIEDFKLITNSND